MVVFSLSEVKDLERLSCIQGRRGVLLLSKSSTHASSFNASGLLNIAQFLSSRAHLASRLSRFAQHILYSLPST
jgi:hypothetical protein